jgi:hypothetical protein
MPSYNVRPKWWQVYLTFPLLIVLFMLNNHLKLSVRGHQAAQIGILILIYGIVHSWIKANATALSKMDQRQLHGTVTVIRVPSYQLPESNNHKYPMFHLPDSEIKGTLSDTFEMDYIDVEFSSVEGALNETKKEEK